MDQIRQGGACENPQDRIETPMDGYHCHYWQLGPRRGYAKYTELSRRADWQKYCGQPAATVGIFDHAGYGHDLSRIRLHFFYANCERIVFVLQRYFRQSYETKSIHRATYLEKKLCQ